MFFIMERGRPAPQKNEAGETPARQCCFTPTNAGGRIGWGVRSEPRHRPLSLATTVHMKMEEISSLIGRHDEAIQKACFLLGFASLIPTY
jgi:hypothetical protein